MESGVGKYQPGPHLIRHLLRGKGSASSSLKRTAREISPSRGVETAERTSRQFLDRTLDLFSFEEPLVRDQSVRALREKTKFQRLLLSLLGFTRCCVKGKKKTRWKSFLVVVLASRFSAVLAPLRSRFSSASYKYVVVTLTGARAG